MRYEDVNEILLKEFPEFKIDEDDFELPYIVAGFFTEFVLQAFNNKDKTTYLSGLQFIESLHLSESHKVRELATVGYLESIQNTWPPELLKISIPYNDLGIESKKWWEELNLYWSNKVKYIGESFEISQ
jgi:hypothetical protein